MIKSTVEIREVIDPLTTHRMLVVDGAERITAMHFPARDYTPEEWLIVAELGLAPARVHSEADARAWLEFLARD
ncbi:hypothetical protein [Mycolicibacterium conceptionense]|uniref:Uncharacterized protein n=1 Tax=Mycolicibacterium conceptionense TaxID=451644 RepID=A0A1A1ZKL6_9MYCO|nr:hypothetical protein [Mycolicibacterium conceptionense]OBF23085.1 hypothetical protein A5726_12270 [Mycolicibacterium conceptionense]OBF44197.1 hypothetical protein A5720_00095 [Mycolicibacterium conceptionense]OBH92678.1 hypothetical protein A5716_28660 [Mycolicibacterium conceptionense]